MSIPTTTHQPTLIFQVSEQQGGSEVLVNHDYTQYVEELNVVHNDIDAEGSGRDVKTGVMHRTRVAQKHTLTVKLIQVSQAVARAIFHDLENKTWLGVVYQSPCSNALATKNFYCSSVNFGSQRYIRESDKTVYQGMNFKLIEI